MIEMTANGQVIGGLTPEAGIRAQEVYQTFCDGKVCVTDAKTAEMAKLTENAFRDVNIAFANELSLIADKMGIDVWELIELANKHPRVNILSPGPGVGGHCIAVGPWFIVSSDRDNSNLLRTAREVNDSKPAWVINKVEQAVKAAGPKATVALLSLALKPTIDDLRESPALNLATELVTKHPDTNLLVAEPYITELPAGLASADNVQLVSTEEAITGSGVVVLLVDHDEFNNIDSSTLDEKLIVDTRGSWEVP